MIQSFRNRETEDIHNGTASARARRLLPQPLWKVAQRKLDQLDAAAALADLLAPSGNRLEILKGDRRGQHSIRINDQYRVCFRWADTGPHDVEITDYHRPS